jgi:hypothetical protein
MSLAGRTREIMAVTQAPKQKGAAEAFRQLQPR